MPNDTPDYQPGANYVAVPQPVITLNNIRPGPYNVNVAPYTSVLVKVQSGVQARVAWLDANGDTIGSSRLHEMVVTGQAFGWVKLPCPGVTMQLYWEGGAGTVTVYGGTEALTQGVLVGSGQAVTDTTYTENLSVSVPTTAGTAIALGQTISSGRCWLNWSFTAAITGYLVGQAFRYDGAQVNLYPATSAQATTLQGTSVAAFSAFVNLPAQVVTWQWVPGVTNAANQSCGLTLVRG